MVRTFVAMQTSVADVVVNSIPALSGTRATFHLDLSELEGELLRATAEVITAKAEGIPLSEAVRDSRFQALTEFHQALRDSLFVEIPGDLDPWIDQLRDVHEGRTDAALTGSPMLWQHLIERARKPEAATSATIDHTQQAMAELLIFEAVRLRLLVTSWSTPDFEALGGDTEDIDAIAWEEVEAMLGEPALSAPDVRPMPVMFASAALALARTVSDRAAQLRHVGGDMREQLRMRARLRMALRELRLPEAVLLENALASLLGEERIELTDLQAKRPLALEGLSRQSMDQRVSRGRRALVGERDKWPSRRRPALFDILRTSA